MSESINDQMEGKKTLYTCPCGFCSYDIMEFLKHPFMEEVGTEQNEKAPAKPKEEEK